MCGISKKKPTAINQSVENPISSIQKGKQKKSKRRRTKVLLINEAQAMELVEFIFDIYV